MVIDTSAICAILFNESDAAVFEAAIAKDSIRLMSTANILESAIVIEARYGEVGGREFDLLLHKASVERVAFSIEQIEIARHAWQRYGKGKHLASLNLGDCFAYSLSMISGEPLLFKGADFAQTEIKRYL